MKKIRFQWSLVPLFALALAACLACGQDDKGLNVPKTRICIDAKGTRVADSECASAVAEGKPDDSPIAQGGHRWYYVRQGKTTPPIGGSIHEGAPKAAPMGTEPAAGTEPMGTTAAPAGTEPMGTGAMGT